MEYELVLIRPDELFLKSEPVMRDMMKQLTHNVKVALRSKDITYDSIAKQRLGILIRTPEIDEVIKVCKYLPGISNLTPVVVVGASMTTMKEVSLELAKKVKLTKSKSFAIRAKRSNKAYKYSSKQMEEKIGAYVQTKTKAKVNLTKPDITIYVETFDNKILISAKKVQGIGGLPAGVSGKVVCLMKDDKDFIAAYLFLRRGCEIIPLHFRTNDKEHQMYLNKLKTLDKFAYGVQIKPTNVKGGVSMSLAVKLAKHAGAKSLCMGPINLNKKHLEWMKKSSLPLFTPLVGLNKEELASFKRIIFKKG